MRYSFLNATRSDAESRRITRVGHWLATMALLLTCAAAVAQEPAPKVIKDIPYKSGQLSEYEQERCKLDLYMPAEGKGFATLVWFHGGGLTEGSKNDKTTITIAPRLCKENIAVAIVNYRLSPKATCPAYIEDAAASVAWIIKNIKEHGGNPANVFVAGHSAGAYLTAIVGYDPRWLAAHDLKTDAIAGLIPVSPQVFTHYTIRQERGIKDFKTRAIIDELAPAYHARKDAPPTLIFVADKDMATRPEENAYFAAMLKNLKHPDAELRTIPDRNHGSVAGNMKNPGDPVYEGMLEFIKKRLKAN